MVSISCLDYSVRIPHLVINEPAHEIMVLITKATSEGSGKHVVWKVKR